MRYDYISWDTMDLITDLFLESILEGDVEVSIDNMNLSINFDSVSENENWSIGDTQKFKYYFMNDGETDVLQIQGRYYEFFLHLAYKPSEISTIYLGTNPVKFGSDYFCQIKLTDCVEDKDFIYLVKKLSKLAGDGAISRLNKGAKDRISKIQRRDRLVEVMKSETLKFNGDEWIIISKISKIELENPNNWNEIFTYLVEDIIKYAMYIEYILVEKEMQIKKSSRFFTFSDFSAFDEKFATSEEDNIIADRQYVVDNRLKYLHFNEKSGQGLMDFFKANKLYPHWQINHLTNVIWPFPIANGGYVDYVRMGYGKDKSLVKELAKRSGVFTEITDSGTRDVIAFFCVTQLQLGLNQSGWWINLYIDKKGWIEQYNLLDKINSSKKMKNKFIELLEDINNEGYVFYVNTHPYQDIEYDENDPEEFINALESLRNNKNAFSISIEKFHGKDSSENNINMLEYLKDEFTKLLPLYNYISWHPQNNNYLGI